MADYSRSICVFCGSRDGVRPEYGQMAEETGRLIAQNGWRLVYGAGDVGLMGRVARTAQDAGGNTFGVIPVHLFQPGEYWLKMFDAFAGTYGLVVIGFFEIVVVTYVYGYEK